MEVAQIGSGIVKQLKKTNSAAEWRQHLPPESLIETICLAHDLGHPPFGHGGEIALNHMMRKYGGFEGNGQTLRIVSKLDKYTERHGMDLTRRTMLGVLKYPVRYSQVCAELHKDKDVTGQECSNHRQVKADDWKPPKCYFDEDEEIVSWILEPLSEEDKRKFKEVKETAEADKHNKSVHKSFDTTIMDLSDDIAYGVHDL
jgi:dGTPase